MKSIAIALVTILGCIAIGSAFGNPRGGFIAGVILAITLASRYGAVTPTGPD